MLAPSAGALHDNPLLLSGVQTGEGKVGGSHDVEAVVDVGSHPWHFVLGEVVVAFVDGPDEPRGELLQFGVGAGEVVFQLLLVQVLAAGAAVGFPQSSAGERLELRQGLAGGGGCLH